MQKTSLSVFLFILISISLSGQYLTDSNLPIIIINTDSGAEIQDEPKIPATMKIIYRGAGERNYMTDQSNLSYLNYNGRIGIELRGSSSQESPKKQYGFTTLKSDDVTNNNVSLLGMPSENDWILNGMTYDTALIRDFLCYNLSRLMGNYAPRTSYCEVIINNDYKGLYVLQEKIKADKNRVDVIKISSTDNNLPEVSGGYITKADKPEGDPVAWTMYTHYGSPVDYIHVLPKPENATTQQTDYIKSCFLALEKTAREDNSSFTDGYPSVIDVPSFIDFMIIGELAANVDTYTYSTYFHKDRNGKLRAGPVWDFDLTFGNDLFFWGYDRSKTTGWYFNDYQLDGSTFWIDLFKNDQYRCYFSKRWNELTQPGQKLNPVMLNKFIDSTVTFTAEGTLRNFVRWNINNTRDNYISKLKDFVSSRIDWITENIGSCTECSNVSVPRLVINKIMYNPPESSGSIVPDSLEFIGIFNNSSDEINLTGIYFRGTGLVYQFPADSILKPGHSAFLASNASAFKNKYGFVPFGQYTRNLSNKSQSIVLADGFGNVIDIVTYSDSSPWPDADGNGSYLELISNNSDNNIATNWKASNGVLSSAESPDEDKTLMICPNPVRNILKIQPASEIISISLFDLKGCLLFEKKINQLHYELDMSGYAAGIYLLKVSTADGAYYRQVVKN